MRLPIVDRISLASRGRGETGPPKNLEPTVEKLMQSIRVTIHPEDVPLGYEAEAIYRVPKANEHTMPGSGLQKTSTEGEPYFIPRLVLTPKRPSLAQRVKDSGWRCPVRAKSLVYVGCSTSQFSQGWHLELPNDYVSLRSGSPLALVAITEKDYGVVVQIDDNGYPIVEEEQ